MNSESRDRAGAGDIDDRLVSYALGLSDPDEAAAIDEQCRGDPELQARIAQTVSSLDANAAIDRRLPDVPFRLLDRVRDNFWVILVVGTLVVSTGGAAYYYTAAQRRAAEIADLHRAQEQLGLRNPIDTDGFVLAAKDTVSLTARIDARSISRVLFRPADGEQAIVLYESATPEPGVKTIVAKKQYDRNGPYSGRRLTASVEFVPFADVVRSLPSQIRRTRHVKMLVAPSLGIILDPTSDPVSLDITTPLRLRTTESLDIRGVAFTDGVAYILIRPAGEGAPWWVQNSGRGVDVRAGHIFAVPCQFGRTGRDFEIAAVVIPSAGEWPAPAELEIRNIPTVDKSGRAVEPFGPITVTVDRPKANE